MAFELFLDQRYNQGFNGHAELCAYTFSLWPEQIPVRWQAQKIIDAHSQELAKENSKLLELRAWEDTSPTWETNYYVEVVATASPLFWTVIIAGVFILLAIGGTLFIVNKVEDITRYVGEEIPGAIPWLAIGGIAVAAVVGIALVRSR